MDEEIVLSFVRSAIKSAWSLELLLLLYRDPRRLWTAEELVREMRASTSVVDESVRILTAAAVVEIDEAGAIRYAPPSGELAELATALVDLHRQKPVTVLRTIFTAPNEKIRSFADAFLFRRKPEQ